MDYRSYMKNALYRPLVRDDGTGVAETIAMLDEYNLLKEDFDSLMEISQWTNQTDPMAHVATKVRYGKARI